MRWNTLKQNVSHGGIVKQMLIEYVSVKIYIENAFYNMYIQKKICIIDEV